MVEEKRAFIEEQLARIFYGAANAPVLTGKHQPDGTALLSEIGVLDPGTVRRALVERLAALGMLTDEAKARDAALRAIEASAQGLERTAIRGAYFCSGCPHNTSTLVPEGSTAMGATGCHGLAHFMPERRTMQTVSMGQEGMPWVGAQSFVDTPHMFQNLGDGTYTHSGLLTIRASIAAKSNVTFKILYNDAVAMTGGQPAEGALTPEQIVHELVAEGVASGGAGERRPLALHARATCRPAPACSTATISMKYNANCASSRAPPRSSTSRPAPTKSAAAARRGELSDPDKRLYINPAVCEGCGDCSVQSNCLSVMPVETEFGRKRAIDQSTCNKDFSCIKGYCPSFVTVEGGTLVKRSLDDAALAGWSRNCPFLRFSTCRNTRRPCSSPASAAPGC